MQGQGHQTCYELLDPEQRYNRSKFEIPSLNNVRQNANIQVFIKSENT